MLTTAVHAEVPTEKLRSMIYAYPTLQRALEVAVNDLVAEALIPMRRLLPRTGVSSGERRLHGTGPAATATRRACRSSYAGRQASATAASWSVSSTVRGCQGSKPVERFTASYQCGAQTPSESRGPAGQVSIRSVKSRPSQSHSQRR